MGWSRTSLLRTAVVAGCLGFAAACNAITGIGQFTFNGTGTGTGTGASASSGTMSSSASSSTGSGGADAAPPPATLWSLSFGDSGDAGKGDQTVTAIAVAGPGGAHAGHVYLTGRGNGASGLGCHQVDGTGDAGYLVELDPADGTCPWAYVFGGPDATGTGVAVDPTTGYVALTGTFTSPATVQGWLMTPVPPNTSSFVAYFDDQRKPLWVLQVVDDVTAGDHATMGVAANGSVAVAGSFTKSLGLIYPGSSPAMWTTPLTGGTGQTGFVVILEPLHGQATQSFTIASVPNSLSQTAEAVALTPDGGVAVSGMGNGDTHFNGNNDVMAMGGPNIFLADFVAATNSVNIKLVLASTVAQDGRRVAFDPAGNVLLGGTFSTGSLDVSGSDAGPALTTKSATSVVVALYDGKMVNPPIALQLGGALSTDTVTIGGLASFGGAGPGALGPGVVFAGGFVGSASLLSAPSLTGGPNPSIYVAKVDTTLSDVLWLQSYGNGAFEQQADAVAVDPSDATILVAGHFMGVLDLHDPKGTLAHTASSTNDVFVAKLRP